MKKRLFGAAITAAFAFSSSPVFAADPFSGFNAGLGVGYDNSSYNLQQDGVSVFDTSGTGIAGRAFVGWGGRHDSFVYGADLFIGESEADNNLQGQIEQETGWTYGANLRLGWMPVQNTAIYGLGTVARTKFKVSDTFGNFSESKTKTGWGVGLGMETKVATNVSARLEWSHIWYDSLSLDVLAPGVEMEPTRDVIMISVLYNF